MEDTKACVASIHEKLQGEKYEIVIVDNGSPNGSGKTLMELFGDKKGMHVLLNERNEGFARGNNVGFRYAKYSLGADFIVMLNSDTTLLHGNVQKLVEEEYGRSRCGVIGPKIITLHPPFDANPGPAQLPRFWRQLKALLFMYAFWLLSYLDMDLRVARLGRPQRRRMSMVERDEHHDERVENVELSGCFWVFTPAFIEIFDGLCDKTFLYNEEPILFLRCRRAGLKTVYLPSIEIFHKGSSSTGSLPLGGPASRRRFGYRHNTASKWVLIGEILCQ